jgi:hypothetical protein
MSDKRIWQPDETCNYFLLESSCTNINFPIFRFRVPDGEMGVIASVSSGGTQFTNIAKDNSRIIIKPGKSDNASFPLNDFDCMQIYGSLMNVEENVVVGGGGILRNVPGIIISAGTIGTRPCRIVLRAGTPYEVIVTGNGGTQIECSLFGWTFPDTPA